ncbi:hypothetical protein OHB36_23420 [Streptomyces sp. NBC_00320]|nr:hypothetical protein [Streptomyces sp. NBC_00320]MCX5149692.1 hypothetical protein [Streptomyces sp. NBC_00320]
MLERDLDDRFTGERRFSGEQFEADHTHGVQVGRGDGAEPLRLFGSHVQRRPEDRVRVGDPGARRAGTGDAEVGDRHPAVLAQHQVRRLDVAVRDPLEVRGVQRVQGLAGDVERLLDGERPGLRADLGQRPSLDEIHDDVRDLLTGFDPALAVVVHVDDARVAERGEDRGLAAKARGERGVVEQRGQQDLHRDLPSEHVVVGAPDLAHAATADPLGQCVPVP